LATRIDTRKGVEKFGNSYYNFISQHKKMLSILDIAKTCEIIFRGSPFFGLKRLSNAYKMGLAYFLALERRSQVSILDINKERRRRG
jgi:hypothetical protein